MSFPSTLTLQSNMLWHTLPELLSLALLVLGILTDHPHNSAAVDHLALIADLLN
jgi:hypothetical protein